ncbi:zonular occludens toxin domain-containing protein [Stenotrophomonas sp. 278]|uniref:zonular occludens toxin domain-containing protein n=1 Tax=Stenotrophomonas sp. 278 TaxID=2479851 RepID=UPI000F65DA86|nr:zonular occludens toxin domain-containing protein [Stenotrophomonas sp. 278]RRU12124.1 hypothetical protein EGJ34_12565 [Stenotrophomonas sp. 278]
MLHLITGQNGSGKSLRAIQLMYKRHGEGMEVYAFGFRGLRAPFVKHFDDPRKWRDLPSNAVLFIDEAQQIWRTRSGGRPVPPEVLDLETHRHQGIDIYLLTQSPMYLDSHLRPLISSHEHLVSYDKGSARIFRFTECYEDVKSSALRSKAQFEVWKYPTEHYADYDSAEVHTAKAKVPWRNRIAKLCFVLAGLFVVGAIAWFFLGPDTPKKAPAPATSPARSQGFFGGMASTAAPDEKRYATTQDYMQHHTPRVAQMPWSMPAMDNREVSSEPQLYCMSSGEGLDGTCTCLTEQGTRWLIPLVQCRQLARWGPAYNPYKEPRQIAQVTPQQPSTALGGASGPVSAISHNVYYVIAVTPDLALTVPRPFTHLCPLPPCAQLLPPAVGLSLAWPTDAHMARSF